LVKAGQSYLRPKFGHYSTVITDVFFDYFLIKNWSEFSASTVEDFIQKTYDTLDRHEDYLSGALCQYVLLDEKGQLAPAISGEVEGIRRSLTGMDQTHPYLTPKWSQAHLALIEYEDEFEVIFFAFFRELETFARQKLSELASHT
jgi:Protein of unknown function, DUF479.